MKLYYIGKALDIWEWRCGKNLLLPVLTAHISGSALDFWGTPEPESEIIRHVSLLPELLRFLVTWWFHSWNSAASPHHMLDYCSNLSLKPTELLLVSSLIFPRSIPHFQWDIIKFRATDYQPHCPGTPLVTRAPSPPETPFQLRPGPVPTRRRPLSPVLRGHWGLSLLAWRSGCFVQC